MIFDKKEIKKKFISESKGLTPEDFLKDRCKRILDFWIKNDRSYNLYKQSGPYWENLNVILKKYSPELYKEYERIVGPFSFTNTKVKKEYDYGEDTLNLVAALIYMEIRNESLQDPDKVHYIEIDGDDIPYIPNQYLDIDLFLGRE
jgi:hypothetical protein